MERAREGGGGGGGRLARGESGAKGLREGSAVGNGEGWRWGWFVPLRPV